MKVADLIGAELALWVARAAGNYVDAGQGVFDADDESYVGHIGGSIQAYAPHEDWAQGGPLLAKLPRFRIQKNGSGFSVQSFSDPGFMLPTYGYGETILIAAMRCLIASKFGFEVEDD